MKPSDDIKRLVNKFAGRDAPAHADHYVAAILEYLDAASQREGEREDDEADEIDAAWLIEREKPGFGPRYLCFDMLFDWGPQDRALRFTRREDAEAMLNMGADVAAEFSLGPAVVTEHEWVPHPTRKSSPGEHNPASALRTAGRGKLLPTDPEDERIVDELVARRTARLGVSAISKSETPHQGDGAEGENAPELRLKLLAWAEWARDMCKVLGFPVPSAKTPRDWLDAQIRSLKRSADWETQEHARHHTLEEELKAKLDAAEASSESLRECIRKREADELSALAELDEERAARKEAESALKLAEHGHHGTRHELDRVRRENEDLQSKLAAAEAERLAAIEKMAKARGRAMDAESCRDTDRMLGAEFADGKEGAFRALYDKCGVLESKLKKAESALAEALRDMSIQREAWNDTENKLAEAERKVKAWEPGVRLAIATCGKDWSESDYDAICDWSDALPAELRPTSAEAPEADRD